MAEAEKEIKAGDALIVVDVQNDFCPGGALAIAEGDKAAEELNRWIEAALEKHALIYVSRDWHPAAHPSFVSEGGPWPVHCVEDTPGAEFFPGLKALSLARSLAKVVTKGVRYDRDQYSAFDETGLAYELRKRSVGRVWIGGLALDVCVKATALDAVREGFETHVILAGCRPVTAEGGRQAVEELLKAGVFVEERQL
jgi:nicotinamidase/pyrazinamidase